MKKIQLKCVYGTRVPGTTIEVEDEQADAMVKRGDAIFPIGKVSANTSSTKELEEKNNILINQAKVDQASIKDLTEKLEFLVGEYDALKAKNTIQSKTTKAGR